MRVEAVCKYLFAKSSKKLLKPIAISKIYAIIVAYDSQGREERANALLSCKKKGDCMAKSNSGIAAKVRPALESVVESLGYRIWDIVYVKEGADFYLRITIDRDEGVDIDGCELVHRAIDPVLDEIDPIQDAYYLQVESPGLERELRTPEHFVYCNGEKIVVKLYKPVDGQKMLAGVLSTVDGKEITLNTATGAVTLPIEAIAKANILFEFD